MILPRKILYSLEWRQLTYFSSFPLVRENLASCKHMSENAIKILIADEEALDLFTLDIGLG